MLKGASVLCGRPSSRVLTACPLLSLAQLYVNISFAGLGALLDLAPAGAEYLARRMIEQERLRGWIECAPLLPPALVEPARDRFKRSVWRTLADIRP